MQDTNLDPSLPGTPTTVMLPLLFAAVTGAVAIVIAFLVKKYFKLLELTGTSLSSIMASIIISLCIINLLKSKLHVHCVITL